MSRNSIQILISILLIIICCCASFHFVSANTTKTLSITQNYQEFIDLEKYPDFAKLYHSGEIKFNTLPETDIQIIEKDNVLVFWIQGGVSQSSSNLEVSLGEKVYNFALSINIQRNLLDYTIQEDMYQLSLQQKSLSCESSATADILESFTGQEIHEDKIIELLPKGNHYNILPEEHPGDVAIWGNPELGFVGHIDSTDEINAKQKLMTGYGVYEPPISDIYRDYGFYTQIFNITHHSQTVPPKNHLLYILKKLESGSMVQLWGDWCTRLEYDDGMLENKGQISSVPVGAFISAKNTCYNVDHNRDLNWKYYNTHGKLIDHIGLDGQHAFILLGWKGPINNPTHIRVWDTDTGYHLYPTHEWMRKWKAMDYRSIIISKKDS